MKREGRQHGLVRTHSIISAPWNPRPNSKNINQIDSPPTAGLFTKVSTKPTNHSKFTGKCGRPRCRGCHMHPVFKSMDKIKGAQKVRSSSDVVSNARLITWRIVDARPGLKFSGFSATGVLDYLDTTEDYDYYNQIDHNINEYDVEESSYVDNEFSSHAVGTDIEEVADCDVSNSDDGMDFCEVGFVLESVDGDDDNSWCLVEEM